MRKILLIILLIIPLIFSNLLEGQDIVYDSLRGNHDNWRKIRWGTSETLNSTWFENEGIIVRSKVLLSARVYDGLVVNVDYKVEKFPFPTNIILTEIKTSGPINLIIYKYYGPIDTIYYLGLRKASLGNDLFTGQYMLIDPFIPKANCVMKVYNGIGDNRQLFKTLTQSELTDADIGDYELSDQVTVQTISGTSYRIFPKIISFTPVDTTKYEIKAWPIPVSDNLNLEILHNDGLMVRIFDSRPSLRYEEYILDEKSVINVSSFKSGLYFLVVSDKERGNIYKTIKIIIIN